MRVAIVFRERVGLISPLLHARQTCRVADGAIVRNDAVFETPQRDLARHGNVFFG